MLDFRNLFARSEWFVKLVLLCFLSTLLLGSSCPTPETFPPPPLSSPSIETLKLTIYKSDSYRSCVSITWTPPLTDSLSVKGFIILQKTDGDSNYSILVKDIPGNIVEYFDNIDRIILPTFLQTKTVRYKIYATDSLGRSSDTSSADSITLLWSPTLLSPHNQDTIQPKILSWSIRSVMSGFYTYLYIYNEKGLFWKNENKVPTYLTENQTVTETFQLPDSIIPLAKGYYYWAIKIDAQIPRTSIESGGFYVP